MAIPMTHLDTITEHILTHARAGRMAWAGRMSAKEQRRVLGTYLGKGTITLDLPRAEVLHTVSVCFGTDWMITKRINLHTLTVENWT